MPDQPLASLLFVDDEQDAADLLAMSFRDKGYRVVAATSGAEGLECLQNDTFDLVLTDYQMPGMTGVELCRELRARHPDVISIILTGLAQVDVAIEAIRAGASDFLTKPARGSTLTTAISRALEQRSLAREVTRLRSAVDPSAPIPAIVGSSPAMRRMVATIRRIAASDAPVLVTGESGTGKELAARALHDLSPRCDQPFVAINCAAVPANLLESELFGHLRGAFTDARDTRTGLFLQAGRGTVFLDEIGEMPVNTQAKLLRVLQERRVRPVGSDEETPFHARVVTATNRDLETEVEEHRFREDLFHRINVLALEMPPLRDRAGDVVEIANAILAKIAVRTGRSALTLSPLAARKLVDYPWPGNVRELENTMESAVAMTAGEVIDEAILPAKVREHVRLDFSVDPAEPDDMITLDEMASRYAKNVLEAAGGNKTHAARILGIDRRSLYRRLER